MYVLLVLLIVSAWVCAADDIGAAVTVASVGAAVADSAWICC